MTMTVRKTAACAALALTLTACEGARGIDGGTLGTIGGAAGGALIGSQIGSGTGQLVATAVGTLVGALAGRELGQRLSPGAESRAVSAERRAVAQNEPITWNDPEGQYRGSVTPVRTFRNQQGDLCRVYEHTIYVEGQPETARGTACRQNDGTWQLVG